MKHNWSYSTIGVELKTSSGGTPNKMHKEFYEGGNIPWLRSGEVCKKNITETEMFITQKGMDNSSAKWFPENTVLVAMYGATAGQVGILRFPSTTNQAICGIFPNDKFLPEFLYYTLLYSKDTLVSQAVGNAQPNISQIKVKEVPLPKISIEEQQRIVDILDKEFEKIDTLKANAEKGLQYATNLFQSALKQELLPKEGWMIKSLDMISTFSQGVQVEVGKQFTEKLDGYMRFLRIVDFTQGNEPPRYVDIIDERYQVKKDSLSVVRYGASAGFICTGQEGVIANNIFKIEPKRDTLISNAYLYYVLISDIFQSVIRKNVNGAAMPAISFGMIKDVNIPYPSIQEQNQIVAHLNKLKAHCNNLQKNYEKTIALCDDMKQALLRKAFNGEL